MNNMDMASFVIGTWQSEPRKTEWGGMTMQVTFTADNTFNLRSYFDSEGAPIVIRGQYRLEDFKLYSDSWNKGKPISISREKNNLILKTANDDPIVLHRTP